MKYWRMTTGACASVQKIWVTQEAAEMGPWKSKVQSASPLMHSLIRYVVLGIVRRGLDAKVRG